MALPTPAPGLVIRYAFLWRDEFDDRQEEARKDRPCAVILAAPAQAGGVRVYVLPVTHSVPNKPEVAIEIPPRVKQHLGLDGERPWIVLDEINDFIWPGFDLRPVPGARPARMDYGMLPPRFFETVRTAFRALALARRVENIPR